MTGTAKLKVTTLAKHTAFQSSLISSIELYREFVLGINVN